MRVKTQAVDLPSSEELDSRFCEFKTQALDFCLRDLRKLEAAVRQALLSRDFSVHSKSY